MKNIPRRLSLIISAALPEQWIMGGKLPCFLPFYHVVSNVKLPYIQNYPYRDEGTFEKELDFVLKYFKPAGLEEIITGNCSGGKYFHLSFDDGLRQCAEVIAPLLLRKGIPATFFLNTGFVDNKKLFHRYKASLIFSCIKKNPEPEVKRLLRAEQLDGKKVLQASVHQEEILNEAARMLAISFDDFLKKERPYLSSEQVLKLASDGFTIGAHSHTHPEFWKISETEQLTEVKTSMDWVSRLISPAFRVFSFPFTDSGVPASLISALRNDDICDVTFGTAGIKKDQFPFHLQRYPAEQEGDFRDNLRGEIVYYYLRAWAGKETVRH